MEMQVAEDQILRAWAQRRRMQILFAEGAAHPVPAEEALAEALRGEGVAVEAAVVAVVEQ